jgi:hypothetical protein
MVSTHSVHHNEALKTPQFYLLWGAVCGNAIAGVTIISCAKNLMGDIFASALPTIVTGTFAAGFVMALRFVLVYCLPVKMMASRSYEYICT